MMCNPKDFFPLLLTSSYVLLVRIKDRHCNQQGPFHHPSHPMERKTNKKKKGKKIRLNLGIDGGRCGFIN